jgi:hypothetical protein
MPNILYLNQYFTTTINVGGGIDDTQTTGIIIADVSGVDTTKPGIALINYSDPLNTTICEWIEYTSINGSKEFVGVTRGSEGFSAKSHDNGVVVAFPLSESHINRLADALSIGGVATNPVTQTLDEDDMASNSAVKLATQQSIKAYVDNRSSTTGWIPGQDTWTYASATTFTIAGVDRTSIFTKGTKLFLTQTTGKYFYVVSSAFGTDTTVTVTAGDDYSLANAAITAPYYSYQSNPQGFPKVFNYTPTLTGFSANPTNTVNRFFVDGTVCTITINHGSNGTSNATGFTATLPITAKTLTNASWAAALSRAVDNGTTYYGEGNVFVLSAGTTMSISAPNGNWTASGGKACTLYFSYEI